MRVSVAMGTYNGAAHIRQQLDSIATQTRLPDELVVSDDNSRDRTLDEARTFAQTAPFTVHVFANDRTLGSRKNFERAISLCSGDLIACCDQDDIWLPDKLRAGQSVLESAPGTGLVFTDAHMVDETLRPLGYRLWESARFGRRQQRMLRNGRALNLLL